MNLFAVLTAPAVAFGLVPIGETAEQEMGTQERIASRSIQTQSDEVASTVEASTMKAAPVQLVSWDGDFEFMKTSRRMRIWRSHIAYRLTVDAEGNPTDCELTETFRMRRVSDRLCDVLMAHHTFEPAQDESGNAVEGDYSSRLSYREMQDRL